MFGTGKKTKIVSFSRQEQNQENQEKEKEASITNGSTEKDSKDPDDVKYRKEENKLSTWYSLVIAGCLLGLFMLVMLMDQRLPQPLTLSDVSAQPDRFIEERARRSLRALTSIGPRPAGSYQNEVIAVDLIVRELSSIRDRAKPIHKVSIDVQKPRGSFNLKLLDGLTHSYRNIQNVIARVESGTGAKHALLVNCHFDSVPQSPGASDDAVSCAIMLEVLEVLTQSPRPLRHNLVFLFNGAEENMLPGSHGFITQHVWAEEVRAFINLESCGSGGREMVFQTGPGHPWLLSAYAEVAPHPFASIIGQEVFQSGVIPADTDFRIFRDYGNIPGLDIAYMKNGYVYHTKYDSEDMIPAGSIQRAGDNVLAVVRHIAQSEILADTKSHQDGSVVFFDLLGVWMVCYSEWTGRVINLLIVFYVGYKLVDKARNSYRVGVSCSVYVKQLAFTACVQVCGCVASFLVVTFIATLIDVASGTMSWYRQPWIILFLYMFPTVCTVIAIFFFALPKHKKYFQFSDGIWVIESLYFEVSRLVWTLFTLGMTLANIKSSFFCMSWVLFPSIGRAILDHMYERSPSKRRPRDVWWLIIHLTSLLVPLVLNMYLTLTTFAMFIPIMSRSGSWINPDLIIGYKAVGITLTTISFLCPLAMVIKKPLNVIWSLYLISFFTMVALMTTSVGFPYSGDKTDFTPHRSLIVHTAREFYNKDGNLDNADSGYFMVNLDRHSPHILKGWFPDLANAKEVTEKDCQENLYCGMPVYFPAASMLRINHWIPAPAPKLYKNVTLELIHQEAMSVNVRRVLFKASGPDHMGVFISPSSGIKMITWSLAQGELLEGPKWKHERPTYYIFHSQGKDVEPWQFWVDLEVPRSHYEGNELLDIAVTGHHIHGPQMKSTQFKLLLDQFPGWSYPIGWTATYKAFKF